MRLEEQIVDLENRQASLRQTRDNYHIQEVGDADVDLDILKKKRKEVRAKLKAIEEEMRVHVAIEAMDFQLAWHEKTIAKLKDALPST